jgi:hypothetical protein
MKRMNRAINTRLLADQRDEEASGWTKEVEQWSKRR